MLLTMRPDCSSGGRCVCCLLGAAILESPMLSVYRALEEKGLAFPRSSGTLSIQYCPFLGDHVDNYIFHVSRDHPRKVCLQPQG